MMKLSLLFGLFLGAIAASAIAANREGGLELEPSQRGAACVVQSKDAPAYPQHLVVGKTGGVIRIRMTFASPLDAPKSEVFYDSVGGALRAAALERVERYRLPCLRPGDAPVVVSQEFVFNPGDGRRVFWSPVRDDLSAAHEKVMSCLVGAEEVPEYRFGPSESSGTAFARFTFKSVDAPPEVDILFAGGNARFASYVRRYGSSLRLPCLSTSDVPLTVIRSFHFKVEGESRTVLKDVTLGAFVRGVDKIEQENVRFDFSTMSCPFEIRFQLRQPVLPNIVGEIERSDPNRREFLEWLKRIDLKIPAQTRSQVLGDAMTVSVPCGVLDLM